MFQLLQAWNGKNGYEVHAHGKQFVVDTRMQNCSCGSWQLCGIPCSHAITCLIAQNKMLVDGVHACYNVTTFLRIYDHVINPVTSMESWPIENPLPLRPPHQVTLTGRNKKSRNKQQDEVKKQGKKEKLKRWVDVKCGWCR